MCSVTNSIRINYFTYYGVKLGDQGSPWDPYKDCYVSVQDLIMLSKAKNKDSDVVFHWYGNNKYHIDDFLV